MVDEEVGGGNMAVAHMVHALTACFICFRYYCVDVENGEKQHRHEYCQQYP